MGVEELVGGFDSKRLLAFLSPFVQELRSIREERYTPNWLHRVPCCRQRTIRANASRHAAAACYDPTTPCGIRNDDLGGDQAGA